MVKMSSSGYVSFATTSTESGVTILGTTHFGFPSETGLLKLPSSLRHKSVNCCLSRNLTASLTLSKPMVVRINRLIKSSQTTKMYTLHIISYLICKECYIMLHCNHVLTFSAAPTLIKSNDQWTSQKLSRQGEASSAGDEAFASRTSKLFTALRSTPILKNTAKRRVNPWRKRKHP